MTHTYTLDYYHGWINRFKYANEFSEGDRTFSPSGYLYEYGAINSQTDRRLRLISKPSKEGE